MNKEMFYGWEKVCAFSYIQTMKSKVMKITLSILCGLILVSMPLFTFLNSGKETETEIAKAYIYCNQDVMEESMKAQFVPEGVYRDVLLAYIGEEEAEEIEKSLKTEEESDFVLVKLLCESEEETGFLHMNIRMIYGEKGRIGEKDAQAFATEFQNGWKDALLKAHVEEEAMLEQLQQEMTYEIKTIDENGVVHGGEGSLDQMEYNVSYIWLMVSMFAILLAGSKIAELIVTEKTSRVMEYLLTGLRPVALLAGKIVATYAVILSFLVAILLSLAGSFVCNACINGGELIPSAVREIFTLGVFKNINVVTLLISLAILTAGFLFYGLLAGLAGATVNKIEDLSEGLRIYTFVMILGVYLVIAFIMMASTGNAPDAFMKFVIYFPLSSVFLVPAYLILGKLTISAALISFALQLVLILLLCIFVAQIFEYVLYHNGDVMKMKEMIEIFKKIKKSGKEEGNHAK